MVLKDQNFCSLSTDAVTNIQKETIKVTAKETLYSYIPYKLASISVLKYVKVKENMSLHVVDKKFIH